MADGNYLLIGPGVPFGHFSCLCGIRCPTSGKTLVESHKIEKKFETDCERRQY